MPKSEKLSAVWTKHADKIVDIAEVQLSILDLLEERLNEAEKDAFIAVADKSSPFTKLPQSTRSYKGANNDGDMTVFVDTGSVMLAFNRTAPALGALQEKVEDVMADVFEKATDYKSEAEAGKFKPFTLPRMY